MLRQGDVKFIPTTTSANDLPPIKPRNDKYIIAEGEATGHYHWLPAQGVELRGPAQVDLGAGLVEALFAHIEQDVEVSHYGEDHDTFVVAPGDYWIVSLIREYTPERIRTMDD